MPRSAGRAGDPDGLYNVSVRVRGVVKNGLLDEAERLGCSLSQLVLLACEDFVRGRSGVPRLLDGVRVPDVADVVRAYVAGERVLWPCGRVEAECEFARLDVAGLEFCDSCGVRVGP